MMMKQYLVRALSLVAAAGLVATGSVAWADDAGDSKIDRVVVSADRAEVTRVKVVACVRDKAEADFTGLSTKLDARTLRAEVPGAGAALGVTSRTVRVEGDRDERVAKVKRDVRRLEEALSAIDDDRAALRQREIKVGAYERWLKTAMAEEARNPKPRPTRWKGALDTLHAKRARSVERSLALQQSRRQTARSLDVARRRLAGFEAVRLPEAVRATVAVDCRGRAKATVRLSYVVGGATWHPEYDLRFTPKGRGRVGAGKAELTVSAIVQQATGEDWRDARIELSTAKPKLGAEAPRPAQLKLTGSEVEEQKVLVQATEKREELKEALGDNRGSDQAAGAELDDRGNAFLLALPERVTIRADGQPYWFPIDSKRGAATSKLVTVPKLSQHIYQTVELGNPAPHPLLAGIVHVYRHGTYVGDTTTEYRAPGEPMEVSLGIDEELEVERVDLLERNRKAGTFSSTKHMDRAYRTTVTNNAADKVTVEVRERIPVSKVEDVEVELSKDKTTKAYLFDAHRGFVTWRLELEPGQKRAVTLHYSIHLPEDWKVQ